MDDVLVVRAQIDLLPGALSGKASGYASGVRPNLVLEGQAGAIAGDITFEGQDWLELGESCSAVVRFVYPPWFPPIAAGTVWRIHEGMRRVGNGRVTEVLATG